MEMSDWQMELTVLKVELNSLEVACGALSAIMVGMFFMQMLFADSWVLIHLVSHKLYYFEDY